jgi:hypothetical protein
MPHGHGVAAGQVRDEAGTDHRQGTEGSHPRHLAFVKKARPTEADGDESWGVGDVTPTLNAFDVGDTRATTLTVVQSLDAKGGGPDDNEAQAGHIIVSTPGEDDPLLPLGLDSHRYRTCGNGVVSSVAEWIGHRLYVELLGGEL